MVRKVGAKKDGEMRMKHGIYVGQHERTSAHLLRTPEGVMRGVGLHRLPEEERWDITFLKQCKGLPWEMRPSQRQNTLGEAFDEDEKSRLAEIPVVLPQKAKKRQFYVLRSDIEKHGVTASCSGCIALAAGMTGVPHSDECRNRILELLEKAEDERSKFRVEKFKAKMDGSGTQEADSKLDIDMGDKHKHQNCLTAPRGGLETPLSAVRQINKHTITISPQGQGQDLGR